MATSIVTPSEKKHCDTSRVSFKVSQSDENNTHDVSKVSFYDEVLSKADPKFLIPIRRWEKRIGFVTPLVWKNILLITSFQVALFVYFTYALLRYGFPKWETVLFSKCYTRYYFSLNRSCNMPTLK